jgi:hypothetical protein
VREVPEKVAGRSHPQAGQRLGTALANAFEKLDRGVECQGQEVPRSAFRVASGARLGGRRAATQGGAEARIHSRFPSNRLIVAVALGRCLACSASDLHAGFRVAEVTNDQGPMTDDLIANA